jgi:hypothetical protein
MAIKARLTASLPKLAVDPATRDRIQRSADVAEVSMADVVRSCIEAALPRIELQLGVVTLDDLDADTLASLGIERHEEEAPPAAPPGCWGRA